jgi:precorrin-2/cobalt-factor-2 C20-methyltransferase
MAINDFDLVGIGVGPGPSELITFEAFNYLKSVQVILAPTTDLKNPGRAETILKNLDDSFLIERVEVNMKQEPIESYQKIASFIVYKINQKNKVAFITLGDPSLYSTFSYIRDLVLKLNPELRVKTISGITAFQLLANKLNISLAQHLKPVMLIPEPTNYELLSYALNQPELTVVLYKSTFDFEKLLELAKKFNRFKSAYFGKNMGMPGEKIASLKSLTKTELSYLTTIIFPAIK